MSHRDTHRVRTTQHDRIDPEAADRVMMREWRSAIRRRDAPADDRTARALTPVSPANRGPSDRDADMPPALVHARIARDAVVPGALALACLDHHSAPGEYCFRTARGVCGARLHGGRRDA